MNSFPIDFNMANNLDRSQNEYDRYLTSRSWDLLDPKDGHELYMMRCKQDIEFGTSPAEEKSLLYSMENFDNLTKLKSRWNNDEFKHHQPDWQCDYQGDVLWRDRGKDKTIVVVTHHGQWSSALNLPNNQFYDHNEFSWLGNTKFGFDDFNWISLKEHEGSAHVNPMIYPTSFYGGINQELNSIQKVSEYVKNKFPGNEFYVISDCKTGHSSAILASMLSATKLLLCSGTTTMDSDYLGFKVLGDDNKLRTNDLLSLGFIMYVRSVLHKDKFDADMIDLNSIARCNPQMQIQAFYHVNDHQMRKFIDIIDTGLPNIDVIDIPDTQFTHRNHHIIAEVRRKKYIHKFFNGNSDRDMFFRS